MVELFGSGRVVDLILGVVALEAALLLLRRQRTGTGPRSAAVLANLAAGATLLLALRGALAGVDVEWIALSLAASLVAHLVDLRERFRDSACPDRETPSADAAALNAPPWET